jgi:hypothetical protein
VSAEGLKVVYNILCLPITEYSRGIGEVLELLQIKNILVLAICLYL